MKTVIITLMYCAILSAQSPTPGQGGGGSSSGGGGTSQYTNVINVATMTVNSGNHTMAHILLPNQPSSGYPLSARMTATVAVTGTVVSSVNGFIGDSSFDLSSYGSTQGASSVLFNGSIPGTNSGS